MNSYEFHKVNMITRTLKGKTTALKLGARLVKSKVTKSDPVALGEALIARLRLSLQKQMVSFGYQRPLKISLWAKEE